MKTIAYACLYKAKEQYVDEISLDDITITLIRRRKPRELLKWFQDNEYTVKEKYNGIYYILRNNSFPIQVIVTSKVSRQSQKWITLLSNNLKVSDARRAIEEINKLREKDEKDHADSVLQVAVAENRELFEEVRREEQEMCEALRELMKDEIEEELNKARISGLAEGRAEGIKAIVYNALELGKNAEEIVCFTGLLNEEVNFFIRQWKEEKNE